MKLLYFYKSIYIYEASHDDAYVDIRLVRICSHNTSVVFINC